MKLLIIDDDSSILKANELYLTSKGYTITTATTGALGLALFRDELPDLVILDIKLPDISGYELCRQIKCLAPVPIILLSSLGEEEDKLSGFYSGADDYVVKPFSLAELECRIAARLRGYSKPSMASGRFGDILLQDGAFVGLDGIVPLTEKEWSIFLLLAQNEGKSFSISEIYQQVWQEPDNDDARTVQTHISNLRQKLQKAYGKKNVIRTKWGKGYLFCKD